MSLDPTLDPGLDAYGAGRYADARRSWEALGNDADGDERQVLLALADLAGALEHAVERRSRPARDLLDAARRRLAPVETSALGLDVQALHRELDRRLGPVGGKAGGEAGEAVRALAAAPPELAPLRRFTPAMIGRFLGLLAILAVGFLILRFTPAGEILTSPPKLLAVLEDLREVWWAPLALVGLYAVGIPLGLPLTPLLYGGGIVFGVALGSVLNLVGSVLGAATSFLLARVLGKDFVSSLLGDRLTRFERLVARKGFWPLVRLRFLPVPYPVANYGSALAGVPLPLFLITTGIGMPAVVVLHTYFAAALMSAVDGDREAIYLQITAAVVGLFLLTFVPGWVQGWRRRRRYHRLLAERAERDL